MSAVTPNPEVNQCDPQARARLTRALKSGCPPDPLTPDACLTAMVGDDRVDLGALDNHVIDDRAESNWSLSVVSAGDAHTSTANRAAIYVQHALRHDYDLETD